MGLDALVQSRLDIFLNFAACPSCRRSSACKQSIHRLVRKLNIATLVFTRKSTIDCINGEVGEVLDQISTEDQEPVLCSPCKRAL